MKQKHISLVVTVPEINLYPYQEQLHIITEPIGV